MSFIVQDYAKYISRPILGAGLLTVYNIFVQGYGIKEKIIIYDAGVFAGSILTTKLTNDLIVDTLKISEKSVQYSLIQPVLNAFVYSYAYNFILKNKFNQSYKMRENNINYMIGAFIPILLSTIENPIVNFFTGIKSI